MLFIDYLSLSNITNTIANGMVKNKAIIVMVAIVIADMN